MYQEKSQEKRTETFLKDLFRFGWESNKFFKAVITIVRNQEILEAKLEQRQVTTMTLSKDAQAEV